MHVTRIGLELHVEELAGSNSRTHAAGNCPDDEEDNHDAIDVRPRNN
jgi:hypothetical protein